MGDRLYPTLEQAVSRYTRETGDSRISVMKFEVQREEDGYAVDFHPSRLTHRKAADRLTSEIRKLMNW